MRRRTDMVFLRPKRAFAAVLSFGLAIGLTGLATSVAAGPLTSWPNNPLAAPSVTPLLVGDETVSLLTGLIAIERDLLLGQLFLQDGLVSTEGSHFTHPRSDTLPAIKDGLAKAGAPDLEPLLIALEGATDKDAVMAAYVDVLSGLQKAKAALEPNEQDVMGAVIATAEAAALVLDPSGTTEVVAYQEAWGLLMAARGKLDALTASTDPAVKNSATSMALAFDDVILFAPDPAASAPVQFDPALITELLKTLKGQVLSI